MSHSLLGVTADSRKAIDVLDCGACATRRTAWSRVSNKASHKNVCNDNIAFTGGNRIIPRIGNLCLNAPIKTLLVAFVVNGVRALNVLLERAALATVETADVTHHPLAGANRSFTSS